MNARVILKRLTILVAVALVFAAIAARVYAAEDAASKVQLVTADANPRSLEDTTTKAIVRDYGRAWKSMSEAISKNDAGALGEFWIGFAREEVTKTIQKQAESGVSTRIIDRGHRLEPMFYSVEGSSMQLRDTAQVETQVLDGGKVVASNTATVHYLVIMTPAADHWQVRLLQAVPSF